jgi:ATP-dependent RNA helicase RhlE
MSFGWDVSDRLRRVVVPNLDPHERELRFSCQLLETDMTEKTTEPSRSQDSPTETEGSAFAALGLSRALCAALTKAGYETPTPIQTKAIPDVLEGRDLLGCAQTGTGKTAAFALPILHNLKRNQTGRRTSPRVLVLAPTRELAAQIGASFAKYGAGSGLRHHVIFGGVGKMPQKTALKNGLDILVATPGRLLDLMGEGLVDLSRVRHFVLDEADRMLDMGFIKDVRRIVREVPRDRQTLLFSATMPKAIRELSQSILRDPLHVAVDPVSSTVEPISQAVYFVEKAQKIHLLLQMLEDRKIDIDRALVFTRTKHGANKVAKQLENEDFRAAAIHGNKSQTARERALARFKSGELRVLVATDIAARGIDIKDLSHVINFDLPNESESYVHRVGRTGRAGLAGAAISFCAGDERPFLRDIERLIRRKLDRPQGDSGDVRDGPIRRRSMKSEATKRLNDQAQGRSGGQGGQGGRSNGKPSRPGRAGGKPGGNANGQSGNQSRGQGTRPGAAKSSGAQGNSGGNSGGGNSSGNSGGGNSGGGNSGGGRRRRRR